MEFEMLFLLRENVIIYISYDLESASKIWKNLKYGEIKVKKTGPEARCKKFFLPLLYY